MSPARRNTLATEYIGTQEASSNFSQLEGCQSATASSAAYFVSPNHHNSTVSHDLREGSGMRPSTSKWTGWICGVLRWHHRILRAAIIPQAKPAVLQPSCWRDEKDDGTGQGPGPKSDWLAETAPPSSPGCPLATVAASRVQVPSADVTTLIANTHRRPKSGFTSVDDMMEEKTNGVQIGALRPSGRSLYFPTLQNSYTLAHLHCSPKQYG
ncbi:hypothetical protein B0H63DRAFT_290499 [Podospora didyma]|uniref:Uncharacterized protein n=1 Tax=Podospora didyma TaxID=330526 RepID=A0AAE0K972_9PEZI|nr:hypothetical protein B0H63DRAFT_290499 [Podospora didyma]